MTISLHLHDIRDHDRIRARDSGLRLEVIHRERQGMTDRIQKSFETWAQQQGFKDLTQHMGRYNRAVVRWMWAAWLEQSERITDMAAALDRSHKRSTELLKQCRDHDGRRAAAVAQCAAMAEEIERHRFDILAMNQSLDLLREENERLRVQLAGCGVAAMQNTADSDDVPLYASPVPAPAVPEEWVRLLTECSDDPCQCYCCRMKRSSARALLQSTGDQK